MSALDQLINNIQDRLFDSIVTNHLVYNTCWEDPRIDRELLNIDPSSRVVMLTSAGCNALDYLLDDPEKIYTVDANPNQNALMELKKALFQHGNPDLLFNLFGHGSHPRVSIVYQRHLRTHLSEEARFFWDRNISYFNQSSTQPSFYFRGTSGNIALMMHKHIKRKGLYSKALNMLDASSLQEQKYYYQEVESELWNGFSRWLLKRNSTMAMLGVPQAQRDLIDEECEGGLLQYIRNSMEQVFTDLPIRDNYFWRVYITGSYTRRCCPNYLTKKYFRTLKERVNRIHTYSTTLIDFLQQNPGTYSHFVLLDHQDWMAHAHHEKLRKEWELILQNAAPGTRILFRSAGREINYLPDFIYNHVSFNEEITDKLHKQDRVGTYGSTHLGIVNS